YGYIKNHKKTVKNGQARTRERKSEQKPEAKPKKSQPLVDPYGFEDLHKDGHGVTDTFRISNNDEEYDCINKEMYDDVNVELKDTEPADEEKGDEEMTHVENVNVEHEEQSTLIATPITTKATTSTTFPPDSSTLSAFHQTLCDLENEVKTLRNVDQSSAIHAAIKSEVPTVVKEYLGTNLDHTLHKVIQRHTA
ncbi:hypothetical protein Tco_1208638, partial [Tanacetum coccineum]